MSSDKITLKDGEITYEYDENERLGEGSMGDVFKGKISLKIKIKNFK